MHKRLSDRRRPVRHLRGKLSRLGLEAMEDRLLLATFTVSTTADNAVLVPIGSLRAAILQANSNPGSLINFQIPGSGVHTINIAGALPTLTVPTTIDGSTEPGYVNGGQPQVALNGFSAGAGVDGLDLAGGNTTVIGLTIDAFKGNGITLSNKGGDTIQGSYIGTDPTGTLAAANGGDGIQITGGNADVIGGTNFGNGNLISGNTGNGININAPVATPAVGTIIEANLIGTDISGTKALGNLGFGIDVTNGPATVIGGSAAARNLISANGNSGIGLGAGDGTTVQSNYIGTDKTGTVALGNGSSGILFQNGSNDLVGGTMAGQGNLISGNGGSGIDCFVIGSSNETIQGNFIGTDVTGTVALANKANGIRMAGPTNVLIGGSVPGAGNVISANSNDGILTFGNTNGMMVEGNFIGTDLTGTKALGNLNNGVELSTSNNTIGGPTAAFGNVIAFNGTGTRGDGVSMGFGVTSNAVLSNSIFNNAGLGINLGNNANNQQAPPTLIAATVNGTNTIVSGTFSSRPNGTYTLQFFANSAPDKSGAGQGQTYLGQTTVTTDSNGNATFTNVSLPVAAAPGAFLSSTATDSSNDTSQFGTDITTVGTADLAVGITADQMAAVVGNKLTYTITVTNAGPTLARGVLATDLLPTGVTVVSANSSQGSVTTLSTQVAANIGTLASGTSATVTIVVQIGPNATPSVTNSVSVLSAEGDPNPANNTAMITTPVSAVADLGVSISPSASSVQVGKDLTYSVVVINSGPSPSTGTVLTDTLPAGVTFVSASDNLGDPVTESNGIVTDTIGGLPTNTPVTLTIDIRPIAANVPSMVNMATVKANEADPDTSNNTATSTTTVTPVADLGVVITPSANSVLVGQSLTYSVVVTDSGPSPASNVNLTDTLPVGVTFVSATDSLGNTLTPSAGKITDPIGNLPINTPVTLTIVIQPIATSVPSITNTAQVGGREPDPIPGNNNASVKTTVAPSTDLAVTVLGNPNPVDAGGNVTYTVTAENNGPSPATGVVLTDTLPVGVNVFSATDSLGHTLTPNGGTITDNIGSLAINGFVVLTLVVTPTGASASTITNTATVGGNETDTIPGNNSASATTTVTPLADLSVSIAPLPAPLLLNQSLTYTVTAVNGGPSTATGVVLTDTLPAGVTFVSATDSLGNSLTPVGGTITDTIASLTTNLPVVMTIVVTPTTTGNITDTANVQANETDPHPGNNSATSTGTVISVADLSVTLTADQPQLLEGNLLTYTAIVTNGGPSPATNVVLTDPLPFGLTFVSATDSLGNSLTPVGGTITDNLGTIGVTGTATVTIVVSAASSGSLTNTVSVMSDQLDSDQSNNSASVQTTVLQPAGTLQFDMAAYTTTDQSGSVTVQVDRAGGAQGTVSVLFATAGGSAVPGVDYSPVSQVLTFADGVTTQTVTIPIIDDTFNSHNTTIGLTIGSPTGGAVLGDPTASTVTIIDLDPDLNHPAIDAMQLVGPAGSIGNINLHFTEPLNSATASNTFVYQIINLATHALDPVSQAVYTSSLQTVTLVPTVALSANQFYSVRVIGPGLLDRAGNDLSGDGVTPGADFLTYVARGTKLAYTDQAGHLVSLQLTGGGVLDLTRNAAGVAETLQVLDPVVGKSVLAGHVNRGTTTLAAITGLGRFGQVRVKLKTPPFYVANLPFLFTTTSSPSTDVVVPSATPTPTPKLPRGPKIHKLAAPRPR